MDNVTNWLLAQMLMARPQSSAEDGSRSSAGIPLQRLPHAAGRSATQLANINIHELPTAPNPAPSWDDVQTRYLMHHLLFNSRPLSTQGDVYRHLNREEKTDPAPSPDMFDPSPLPNRDFGR
jgi:hypothetical protein